MTQNQQNSQTCYLDIYIKISHWILLNVSVCKGPTSGYQTKVIHYQIRHFCIHLT